MQQLTNGNMCLQCICSCPTAYADGPSMAPTMAPAMAPASESAPEDMSDDEDDSPMTDSCGKPVPTQYEAFVDVSISYKLAANVF